MSYVKAPFNLADYSEKELELLYEYQNMLLDEEICSPDYISTAREVLSKWGDGRGLLIEIETGSFKPFHKSESYENLTKHSLEYLMARKPLSDAIQIEIDSYNEMLQIRKYFDHLDDKEKEAFINLTKFIGVFYQRDDDIHDALFTVHLTHLIVGSVENINQLFNNIEFESYANCLEGLGNRIWGDFSQNEMQEKRDEQLKILQKISSLGGVEGINMTLNLVADKKSYDMFFAQLEINDITQDNIDDVMKGIASLLFNKDGIEDSNIGFVTSELMPLVEKFRMPTNILKGAFTEIASITKEDNIRAILAPGNIDATPIRIGTVRSDATGRNRTYNIELLPKSSPAGLFFGKMTKSCQFYSGDSSKQAVVPIYTDANTGLIVVKQGETSIKMGSFVWLCKDASGNIGIVLDSMEKVASDLSKIEPEVLQIIFEAFSKENIKVYLGTGGNSSNLSYSRASQETLGISPMSEGYQPYSDSRELYIVTEELAEVLENSEDTEEDNTIFMKSQYNALSDEDKLIVENVFKTINRHNNYVIKELVLNKGINFIDAVKYYDLYKNYSDVEFTYVYIKLVQNNKFDVISSILTELGKGIDEYNYIINSLNSFCGSEETSTFLIKFGSNKEILLGLFGGKFSYRSETIKILNSLDEEATSDFLREYEDSRYDFYVFEKLFPSMQKYAFRFAKYFCYYECDKLLGFEITKLEELYSYISEVNFPEKNRNLNIKLLDFSKEEVEKYNFLLQKACADIGVCREFDNLQDEIKSYILGLETINEKVGKAILQVAYLRYFSGNQSIEIFKKFIEFNEKFPLASPCLPEKSLEFIDLAFVDLLSKFYISNDFVDFILDNKDNSMLQDFLQNAILQKSENGIVWTYINTNISIIESDFKAFSESYIGAETSEIGDKGVVELVGEVDAAGAAES